MLDFLMGPEKEKGRPVYFSKILSLSKRSDSRLN